MTVHELEQELQVPRLAYVDENGKFVLLTKACRCLIAPGRKLYAADDDSGRFSRWVAKQFLKAQ
jgi:hypothetical protein